MNGLTNIMRREAQRAASLKASPCQGIVTSYDLNNYSAKVLLQPEGVETGWLPIRTPWAGNGWGMFCPPDSGDEVEIQFQEDGKQAPYIALRAFGDQFRPLSVPSGEFWIVHKSGSFFKFHNDGTIEMNAETAINSTAPMWTHTGNMTVNGNILASGNITDVEDGSGSLAALRAAYDAHKHTGIVTGSASTGLTDHPV